MSESNEEQRAERRPTDYALVTLRGLAMGAADIVPGVSGGTIALITGIYDELLYSLKQIGPAVLPVLFRQGVPAAWRYINGNFLLALFLGVLVSIKSLASVIGYALDHYPLLVWAFFCGLILASVIQLVRHQPGWRARDLLACALGVAFVVVIAIARPTTLPAGNLYLFLGGFIAICAMILPGVSGSFILLLLGLYPVVLDALNTTNLVAIAYFMLGCISGLLAFSRLLSWLLAQYHQITLATLIGFLIGSLYVTWPWKRVLETTVNRHGEAVPLVTENVLPATYSATTGNSSEIMLVAFCALGGFILVLLVEWLAHKLSGTSVSVAEKSL